MPVTKFNFQPGINKQDSDLAAENTWKDSDLIRFRYGKPEKIGGWSKLSSTAIIGAVREQFAWTSLTGTKYDALGTDRKLYVYSEGQFLDITPVRSSVSASSCFSTASGSSTVTITESSHGAGLGDFVVISSASTSVGGLSTATLNGEYEILTKDTNTFTIDVGSDASSTVATTGNATLAFQVSVGREFSTEGYGWSAGAWGDSTWDTARTVSVNVLAGRQWTFGNFGEDLVAWLEDGGVYKWDLSGGMTTTNRSAIVSNAPTTNRLGLITTPDRHVVCFGTETTIADSSTQDDLFVRWADQESLTDWTPTAVNTAGSQRLSGGSRIECAKLSKGQVLVWTDANLFAMRFVGPPFTFGFNQLGVNCGTVGPHSSIDVNGVAYWMSKDSFFKYDGTVQKIPCTVEDFVFDDINLVQINEVYASSNSKFNEITWFYTSEDGSQIDRYVSFNYLENTWYTGTLARTTWVDTGIYDLPYATEYLASSTSTATPTVSGVTTGRSFLYKHETGTNADGSAMTAYVESGDFDLADGDSLMLIRKLIPDFKSQSGTVNLQLKVRDYPNGTQTTKDAESITTSTTKVDTRARGRQAAIKIYSDSTGANWRLGVLRMELQQEGRR